MTPLPRVKSGLLKHALDNQVLVYDTNSDRVHLLDPTTACLLDVLELKPTSLDALKDQMSSRLDIAANDAIVQLGIEQLRNADLIEEEKESPFLQSDINRRDLVRTVAAAGIAGVLIPSIATLTATRGYAQGTAPNHGVGNTCTGPSQCISGNCCNNVCINTGATCNAAGSIPNGGACNFTSDCATSGSVCSGGFCRAVDGSACTTSNGCQSNRCCNGSCRPNTCTTSNATGSCTGSTVPAGNNATGPDPACCSGTCARSGNSSNYNCTAATCT